jgi:hypothetical protein
MPGEEDGKPSLSTGTVPLTYTGGDSRVSIGIDQDGNSEGELLRVFNNNGEHAIVGQLWWGHGGAGGIQADYNFLFGTTREQARRDPDSITVAKLSFAIDQNAQKDRMANVGLSIERREFFLNFFLSGKASGKRASGALTTQTPGVVEGVDEIGNYTQTRTDTLTTQLEAQPYSWVAGIHGGHFSDALAARFNGGFDYSRGNQGASRKRVALSVDKYLGVRGWSLSALGEHSEDNAVVGEDRNDNRLWLFLRYEFGGGGAFRPYGDAASASKAWIDRALHEPVNGHARSVDTYVTRGRSTTTTSYGPRQYTARRPIARDDAASVAANSGSTSIDVLANDSDPDNGVLTLTSAGPAAHGTVQVSGGHAVYTPAASYVGSDEFTYTITNAAGLAASARVVITVTTANGNAGSPPVARDDVATTTQGVPVSIAVLGNDSDADGDALTVTAATTPAHGSAVINADGSITYTPDASFTGVDRFSYSIADGHGGTASANVTLTVQVPPPPVALDDEATTPFATEVLIDVLANDRDPSGFPLAITSVGAAAHGTATVAGASIRYVPAADFIGDDSFGYAIVNGHGGVAAATVTVTVLGPQGSFLARNDTAQTPLATAVVIDVLANDVAPNGTTLALQSVTTPAHGIAEITSGNRVRYTPAANFTGDDTFNYTVSDGLATKTAKVTVTVTAAPPVAQNDAAATAFNQPVNVAVLANDRDPNAFALTVAQVTTPAHGSVQINPDNTVTYTPQLDYNGPDSFGYTISNGHGGTASANVAITVGSAPPPVANNDAAQTPFNTAVIVNVLANDSDPNALPLTVVVGTPAHGSAHVNGDNTVTYTPQSSYVGVDQFSYTIDNGHGGSANASVTVTVQAPLPPVAVDDSTSTPFATPIDVDVLSNDSDPNQPNGLPLTITQVSTLDLSVGTATINGTRITFTPEGEFDGDAVFDYTISNGYFTASATVTVSVAGPLPPVANPDSADTPADTPVVIDVLANDTDPAGLYPLTVLGLGGVPNASGSAVVNPDSTVTFTPAMGFTGQSVFTYSMYNTLGITAQGTVTVNVLP